LHTAAFRRNLRQLKKNKKSVYLPMDVPRDPRKWIARGRALQIHQTSGCCPGGLRTINDDGGGCSDEKNNKTTG